MVIYALLSSNPPACQDHDQKKMINNIKGSQSGSRSEKNMINNIKGSPGDGARVLVCAAGNLNENVMNRVNAFINSDDHDNTYDDNDEND